ncbi:cytochrome c oxidase subunit 4 [Microbacterium gorillae]|uniref:cytochrome c oxidase subunit 4 n=1 Tax=Microbacterium gorillae TaxID=1231063 RepID=UPI000590A058|nr:cytochrome c oxidase subunit 4 [Microbacterium gorillae]
MRSNVNLWWILAIFFGVVATAYTVWNILENGHPEWVGSVAMYFTMLMGIMIGFYLSRVHKSQGGELPEDTLTADIDDGDPEMGEFSPWSWWPLVLAFSAAIFLIGLAVGQFLLPIGVAIFLVAIVGWVYEYYRGYFAR